MTASSTDTPFFSVVSVARNDAWALSKTARSVFRQTFTDFEYIVVDGASEDGTPSFVEFWKTHGLVTKAVSENDTGVYNAMNKGAAMTRGKFVCFLNASDVFASDDVLEKVHHLLHNQPLDGVLGWGELNDQVWASWVEDEAFKMASLGFCHQSLFVRRSLLLEQRFDERPFKTDSDTLQLGRLFAQGARIAILPEVLAVRGGEPGISANLDRTKISIKNTLTEEYVGLSDADAEQILTFRRTCADPDFILTLMERSDTRLTRHMAYMVLDTLFQKASLQLDSAAVEDLLNRALQILDIDNEPVSRRNIERLIYTQARRDEFLHERKTAREDLDWSIAKFHNEEEGRIRKVRAAMLTDANNSGSDLVVSMTSFPARLKTVYLAIRSLLEQTRRPKEIHLWLGRDEVPSKNWLPGKLRELEEHGLQIHFSPRTFHQYDKYLHNSVLNADAPFVLVDDDVIYPPQALEHLLAAHQQYPDAVIGNRCHKIGLDKDGNFTSYKAWKREQRLPGPSLQLMPTGAGGVLYPIGFLSHEMVTNIDDILSHAPYADDIWLKTCALARGLPTFATALSHGSDWYHRYTPTMWAGTLQDTNVDRSLNDTQIGQCLEWLTRIRPDWRDEMLRDEPIL
jgi:GT2 family glycosyltransferase